MANANSLLVLLFMGIIIPLSLTLRSDNKTLSKVALYLIREHISNLTSTIVIAEHSSMSESADKNSKLLDHVLQHLQGKIAVQFYIRDYFYQPLEFHVFIVDSLEAFKELYYLFEDSLQERHFRFLIFLTKHTPDFLNVMEDIFVYCYLYDVIDVNIIADHPTKGVSMFTYFLFWESVCRGFGPIILYNFNEGFGKLQNVFPNKLTNFHGCRFKVSPRIVPPYFTFIGNQSHPERVGDWENISGFEGTLLKLLAMALNFTIDLRHFTKEHSYVEGNQSYGSFKELKDGEVDIAVGGFVDSVDGRCAFSPTSAHHSSALYFVVRGTSFISSLARLAKPFKDQVWILVACFFVLTVLFTSILRVVKLKVHQFIFGIENQNPVTNFLAVFLGYPISQTPRRNFARFIFVELLLLTLVLRNAYQGSLYDAFRKDKFAWTPSGFSDLVKWNYTSLVPVEAYKFMDIFKIHRTIIKTSSYVERLEIVERSESRFATVVFLDGIYYYFQKNLRNESKLHLIPEVVTNYQFVMFLPKNSIYLPALNQKLKDFDAAGLIKRLNTQFLSNDQLIRAYLAREALKIPLHNERLYALYTICGVLIGISSVVFCLEILSDHYKKLQRIFD